MDVPRFYRLKKLLGGAIPGPGPGASRSSRHLRLRRRILTYAFEDCRGYFSQFGQDKFVDQVLFQGKRNGVFLDVGAYDGVTINNSYFLEQTRGWSGMCVEPQPAAFAALQQARRAICINGCAAPEDGAVDFLQLGGGNEMLSGRVATFEPVHLDLIRSATDRPAGEYAAVRVPAFNLQGLLRTHGIDRVDFLSLDTEGGELDLLKTLDLEALQVRAIAVENNDRRLDVERHLTQAGYRLAAVMGCDEIYWRPERG